MSLLTNNLTVLLYLQGLPLARQLAVGLRDRFHAEGLHYIALKKKSTAQTAQVGFMQTQAPHAV
jgi:hypothetical protein